MLLALIFSLAAVLVIAAVAPAREAADRDARQNDVIAETTQETSAASRRLAAEEARARRDLLLAQGRLQEERNQLLNSWDELERSRQAASER